MSAVLTGGKCGGTIVLMVKSRSRAVESVKINEIATDDVVPTSAAAHFADPRVASIPALLQLNTANPRSVSRRTRRALGFRSDIIADRGHTVG